ncbi:MAG TPA: hypothetical protein VK968_09570 [Roseimicrobium sp.]|nr:hypothetical protein [Roseimicrobium sp.]
MAVLPNLLAQPQRAFPVHRVRSVAAVQFMDLRNGDFSTKKARGLGNCEPTLSEIEAWDRGECLPKPRVFDQRANAMVVVPTKIPVRRRNQKAFYRPARGHEEAPDFYIKDRLTGVVLATVRGTLHHVMGEAASFAAAQGFDVAAVLVSGVPDDLGYVGSRMEELPS